MFKSYRVIIARNYNTRTFILRHTIDIKNDSNKYQGEVDSRDIIHVIYHLANFVHLRTCLCWDLSIWGSGILVFKGFTFNIA